MWLINSPKLDSDGGAHHHLRGTFLDVIDESNSELVENITGNRRKGNGEFSTWRIKNENLTKAFLEKFPGSYIIEGPSLENTTPSKWLTILGMDSGNPA